MGLRTEIGETAHRNNIIGFQSHMYYFRIFLNIVLFHRSTLTTASAGNLNISFIGTI